uniref:C2H2-type domain-containing protein n=1 Tax=Marseillevirus LCMAC101 TaxID=2506602 RepID=A0A481YUI1_9VIRU|nr:MAG: hypothetical protein LCMAC101_07790 [Marseillevirus LCMAC101]
MKIQNKKVQIYECKYCDREFVHLPNLKTHEAKCPLKDLSIRCQKLKKRNKKSKSELSSLRDEIKLLKKENSKLNETVFEQRGTIEGMQTAPDKKTIYNTAIHPKLVNLPINNIRALTDEYVIERVNDGILTYSHAARGYPGMLEVICELITHENDDGIVERNYVCTDVSRNSFHRLLESKKWRADKGGRYLNNMLDTFRDVLEEHKDKVYKTYKNTPHDSIEWDNVDWERKNISKLYSGIVCNEGTGDREELVNILRKEISKRASV